MEFPKKRLYCLLLQGGSSPDVVPGLAAATSPETCWDVNSVARPDPQDQTPRGWGPAVCVTTSPAGGVLMHIQIWEALPLG